MSWEIDVQAELAAAESARAGGNEAQARVRARRAAGIAARVYLEARGERVPSASAYDLLQLIASRAELDPELRRSAGRLILRVDEAFKLPADVDLIVEARRLCAGLSADK